VIQGGRDSGLANVGIGVIRPESTLSFVCTLKHISTDPESANQCLDMSFEKPRFPRLSKAGHAERQAFLMEKA